MTPALFFFFFQPQFGPPPPLPPIAPAVNVFPYQTAVGLLVSQTDNAWFTGAAIDAIINYPFSFSWIYLGLDSTDWTQFVWTVKASQTDADSAAILTLVVSNPPVGTDGLTIRNGTAAPNALDGAIVANPANVYGQVATKISVTINAVGMALTKPLSAFWELTPYFDGVKQMPLDGGQLLVNPSVRAASGQA